MDTANRNVSSRRSWARPEGGAAALRADLEAAIAEGNAAEAARLATILAVGVRAVDDSNVIASKTRRRH